MKKNRYHDMMKAYIRYFVRFSTFRTLEDIIARARERETWSTSGKGRQSRYIQLRVLQRDPRLLISMYGANRDEVSTISIGNNTMGVCQSSGTGCYKCGKIGHASRDCSQGTSPLYLHCKQAGHKKANFLVLTCRAV